MISATGNLAPILPGVALFAIVQHFSFGGIVRSYALAPSNLDTDQGNERAAALLSRVQKIAGAPWCVPTSWEDAPQ